MDDELGRKIDKITQLISNKDIARNLGPLIQLFASNKEESPEPGPIAEPNSGPEPGPGPERGPGPVSESETVSGPGSMSAQDPALKPVSSTQENTSSDARMALLNCLKNFVSPPRKNRIDLCIRMLGLLKIAGGLKDDFRR